MGHAEDTTTARAEPRECSTPDCIQPLLYQTFEFFLTVRADSSEGTLRFDYRERSTFPSHRQEPTRASAHLSDAAHNERLGKIYPVLAVVSDTSRAESDRLRTD